MKLIKLENLDGQKKNVKIYLLLIIMIKTGLLLQNILKELKLLVKIN